jgi:hypothetical protein
MEARRLHSPVGVSSIDLVRPAPVLAHAPPTGGEALLGAVDTRLPRWSHEAAASRTSTSRIFVSIHGRALLHHGGGRTRALFRAAES